ncbi:MAG: hypothetical protein ACRD4O_16130 [Bryobacteraceae bacterium]
MKLNPETLLGNLLTAIPSSSHVLHRLGIATDGSEDKTLGQVCQDNGIGFEEFLRAIDDVDWEEEAR